MDIRSGLYSPFDNGDDDLIDDGDSYKIEYNLTNVCTQVFQDDLNC